jgi:hypothetical protein
MGISWFGPKSSKTFVVYLFRTRGPKSGLLAQFTTGMIFVYHLFHSGRQFVNECPGDMSPLPPNARRR